MIDFPCKNCTHRQGGCHDSCKAYAKVKEEAEEIKKKKAFDNSFRRTSHDKYYRLTTIKNPSSYLTVNRNKKKGVA